MAILLWRSLYKNFRQSNPKVDNTVQELVLIKSEGIVENVVLVHKRQASSFRHGERRTTLKETVVFLCMYVSCPFHLGQIHKLILYALHLVMFILDCYVLRTLHFRKYKNECRRTIRFPISKSAYLIKAILLCKTVWVRLMRHIVLWVGRKFFVAKKFHVLFSYVGTGREKEKQKLSKNRNSICILQSTKYVILC